MTLLDIPLLVFIALATLLAIRTVAGTVAPALSTSPHAGLVTNVWLPLAFVTPLVAVATRTGNSVRGVGWIPLGAPIAVGAIVVAIVLLVARRPLDLRAWPALCWTGAGILLLALGAAHELTLCTGQAILAIAAVLRWINTPEPLHPPRSHHADAPLARATLIMLAVAAAQTAGTVLVSPYALPVAATLILGGVATGGAALARRAGPDAAALVGGWSASLGLLFGVGFLSVSKMVPRALSLWFGPTLNGIDEGIAYGFGAYAAEAVLLALLPATLVLPGRAPRSVSVVLGAVLITIATGLAAWRAALAIPSQ